MDGRPAPAMGETAWPYRCLAPQRTFEQCSPLPVATAAKGPCTPRKSQEATIHLYEAGKRASLEGSFEAVLTLTVAQAQVEATR